MRQLRFAFADDQKEVSVPCNTADEEFDWEGEDDGVPLHPLAIEVADFLAQQIFGIPLSEWSTRGPLAKS